MRVLVENYSFNKTTKQVTFSDYASITLENVLLITDVTNNLCIYQANHPGKGGVVAGNVLTLDFDTNTVDFQNTDKLQIFYEQADSSVISGSIDVASVPAPLNITGSGAAASALRVQLADESLSALENINVTVSNSAVEITNDAGNPIPVSGTVNANTGLSQPLTDAQLRASSVSVNTGLTQPLTDAELRASAVPVSAASLPLPAGAATETTLSSINTKTPALGQANNAGSSPVVISSQQTSAVPAPRGSQGLVVTPAQQNLFRTTFSSSIPSGVDSNSFALVQTGSGQTVAQSGGNLVITAGTTANAETIIRSNVSFNGSLIARVQSFLSQRIANTNFIVELVDVIGDSLAVTVNSATSITITIPSNPFTSANVGQSLWIGAIQGIAGAVPGRYAIASVSGTSVNFTVAGWPASGSGTCSVYGWNYHTLLYTGTTATAASYDTQRRGYNSGFTGVTINTSASPGHMAILAQSDGNAYVADQLVASATANQLTPRGSRVVNLPHEEANLFLQLRVLNGTTAPASSTTWTIGSVSVENYAPTNVVVNEVRPQGQGNQLPVAVTNTPAVTVNSGTITTVSTVASVTSANLGIPGNIVDVASAAITTTSSTGALTPTTGISYMVNIPVTAVTGTNPTLDVRIQESDDTGTNWFTVYDFPRITTTGIYRSPVLKLRGNRIRYVQTVGGLTPSFTRAINRLQTSQTGNLMGQFIDRTIDPNTLNSTSGVYLIDAMTDVSLTIRCSAQTTPAQIAIEFSDDAVNWTRHPKFLTTVAGFSTPLEAAPHWKFVRLITVNAGSGITLEEAIIKAGDVTTIDLATEVTLSSIDSKLNSLGQKTMTGSMPVVISSDQSPIPVTGTINASVTSSSTDILGVNISGAKNNQIEISFDSALDSNIVTTATSGGGSLSTTNGHTLFSTGAGATAAASATSVATAFYRPGNEIYAYFTASFTTPTSANSFQRIGLYDASNGFFIGYNGLNFGITRRFNGVDTFTAASSFNSDLLNAGASSKFTRAGAAEAINYTYSNLFRIRFAWLGSAAISFDVYSPDGQWVTFHVIRQPNTELNPSVANPDLKMKLEVSKSGADATNLTMATACWAAGTTSALDKISSQITDYTLASLSRSVLTGRTTAGGSAYVNVKVTPSGSLMSALGDISDVAGQDTMANSLPVTIASDQSTLPVSAASLPLPAGAATSAIQTDGTQRTRITDGTNNAAIVSAAPTGTEQALVVRNIPSGTQTVSGTVTANTGLDQPLTDTQLRASAVPVSGTVSVNALPAGNNNIGDVDVASLPAPLNVTGAGAASEALRVQIADESLTALENINATVNNWTGSGSYIPLKTSNVESDNPWRTLKTWSVDTATSIVNTKPSNGEFITVPEFQRFTNTFQILQNVKTTPATNYIQYVWIDDGVETYLAGTQTYSVRGNNISALDTNGGYIGGAPVTFNVNRWTPSIKIATSVIGTPSTLTYTVNGTTTATITAPANVFNTGFTGGELVNLTSTSQLPIGLAGSFNSIDTSADTFTLNNVQFADGEQVRVNLTQLSTAAVPPLGICALGKCSNIDLNNNWFVLDSGYSIGLQVGDVVRFRAGANSTLPSLANTAIAANVSYVVTEVSGQMFKLTTSTHGSSTLSITAIGNGIFYVFKYPYVDFFAKGTNQLSLTSGGAAIDFKRLHDTASVTITPGTAASITQNAHGFAANKEVFLTATTVPTGTFQGQRFYVKNPLTNSYNLSLSPGGPAVAFTSAGTTVSIVDPIANVATSVTVTAGTPASVSLPMHFLGAGSDFVLGGTTLPADYTGQTLYVATPTANTFTFSENKLTPCVLSDAGTAMNLSTLPGRNADIMLERRTAYIANSPAPTDNTLSFSYTSGGAAITLAGGSGTQTFVSTTPVTIKAGSYFKIRAM